MDILYKEEAYKIIGVCMEVHRELGVGFSEIIYKDALEIEFNKQDIPYIREAALKASYKGIPLRRSFNVDFTVYDKIILEVKATSTIIEEHEKQTLNYLAMSKMRLGLLVNFGALSLQHRRFIL
jgi:GxxExxY protein